MGDKTTVDFEDLPKLQYMAAVGYFFGHNFVMVRIAGFFCFRGSLTLYCLTI